MNYNFGIEDLLIFSQASSLINNIFNFLNEDIVNKGVGVLTILQKDGPTPISHLGNQLGIRKPNMTKLVDKLEKEELIKRSPSEKDRRIINLVITAKGTEMMNESIKKLNLFFSEHFSILSDEEQVKIMDTMNFMKYVKYKIIEKFYP